MSVSLRRHRAKDLFRLIAPLEERWGLPRRRRRYRKHGTWLLAESFLKDLIVSPAKYSHALPGFKLAHSVGGRGLLMWRRFAGRCAIAECAADAIRVKSNLRVFYITRPASFAVKLVIDQTPERVDGIRNEVQIRSQLQKLGTLRVPSILAHDPAACPRWYSEELISGDTARPGDAGLIESTLVPELFKTYQRFGITWKPAPNVGRENFMARVETAMRQVKWRRDWIEQQLFLRRVRELRTSDSLMPYSISHGDLSPTNIIITPEQNVYVIDWESAAVRPMVNDLCNLQLNFPAARGIFEQIEALTDGQKPRAVLTAADQMTFAILSRIVFWQRQLQRGARLRSRAIRDQFEDLFALANQSLRR